MTIRAKHGYLYHDHRLPGWRWREYTREPDIPENRRRLLAKDRLIAAEIAAGCFVYKKHFEHGRHEHRFHPNIVRPESIDAYLAEWYRLRSPFRADGTLVQGGDTIHPSTWKHDYATVQRLIRAFGHLVLDEVTVLACRAYRKQLQDEGLSGKTVQNILGLFHKAMADAVEDGLIRTNPVPRLTRRGRTRYLRSNCDPLLPEEVVRFLDVVPAEYRDLYAVWFRTGWRPSEILAVRFEWLDWHRETVMLHLGRIPRWGGVEAPPKTGPREVNCGYDPAIFEAFERRRRASLAVGRRDYVFTDSNGAPLSQEWLHKRVWKPTLRRAGFRERGQYNIRDTFITCALSAGEDPGWVARVCGTSEQMIFTHYRRWMPNLDRGHGRRVAQLYDRAAQGGSGEPGPPSGPPRLPSRAKGLKSRREGSGRGRNQFEPPRKFRCLSRFLRRAPPSPFN